MKHDTGSTWPPAWIWIGGSRDKKPKGEVGLLQDVRRYEADANRCFLVIEHQRELYSGCIYFGNSLLSEQMYELLSHEIGQSIANIGTMDIDALWTLTRYGRCADRAMPRRELHEAFNAMHYRTDVQVPPSQISATCTGQIYIDGMDGGPALQGSFTFALSSKNAK